MTTITHHNSLESLCANFQAVAFDAYGVLWDGQKLYDGAADNLAALHACGKQVAIITNTTQLAAEVEAEYAGRGLLKGVHYDVMLTAGDMSRKKILSRHFNAIAMNENVTGQYYRIGRANPQIFAGSNMTEINTTDGAGFVYIGVPEIDGVRQLSVDRFRPALESFLEKELPLFCPNPDYYAPSGSVYQVCQGMIAATYEEMGGKVEWGGGKPFPGIFDEWIARIRLSDRADACMVGDTLRTDIAGAARAGIKSALVTETGLTAAAVINAGTTFEAVYEKEGTTPDFTLSRVGCAPA